MRTASLFKNGRNQAVRIPKELEFDNAHEVEIRRDGRSLILTPVKKSWQSLANCSKADSDFLEDRPDLIEEGKFNF